MSDGCRVPSAEQANRLLYEARTCRETRLTGDLSGLRELAAVLACGPVALVSEMV